MSLTKHVGLSGGAAMLALTSVCIAGNTETNTNAELQARLAAAEARLAELETQNGANWLTEQRAEQIRGLVDDVLADADTRSSLLQSGTSVGYDNGAIIGSADGNWLLRTNLLMQQRFMWNNQDMSPGGGDDDQWGFENTRTKFMLSGHVVNPDWFYRVDINVAGNGNPREGTTNAYLGYNYGNGWMVRIGSMKAPFLREELVEAQHQLAVERSVLNYLFTAGYVDGIAVDYTQDKWRGTVSYNDGAGTGQTAYPGPDTEFAITGRAEWLLSGTWDQFDDFTSPPGGEQGWLLGVAGHYEEGEHGTAGVETDFWSITGDLSYEGGGWGAFLAVMYADFDFNGAASDVSPLGVVAQASFYLEDDWELFGRYEWADLDASGVEDVSLFTVGVNKYFAGHNSKWTTDVGFGVDALDGVVPSPLTGWGTDGADEDGQVLLRTQWQILF